MALKAKMGAVGGTLDEGTDDSLEVPSPLPWKSTVAKCKLYVANNYNIVLIGFC